MHRYLDLGDFTGNNGPVGLNSGPTTAGVLRGEKARFQLFGDVRRSRGLLLSTIIIKCCYFDFQSNLHVLMRVP